MEKFYITNVYICVVVVNLSENEEPTEVATEEPRELEETVPSKEESVCSVCGKVVVPISHETERGLRYQCPECKKFMKPLTREEAKKLEVEERGLPPSDVEARKLVAKELRERLDSVWGIPAKKVDPIVSSLEDVPGIVLNPTALYWHIKQLAPQANDYQLYLFISSLFTKLQESGLLAVARTPWAPVTATAGPTQSQQFPFMFPQQSPQQPFYTPFTPFPQYPRLPQTQEEFEEYSSRVRSIRRQDEREEERHKREMAILDKRLEGLTQPKERSDIVEIIEPIRDEEGKLVKDEKGNIVLRKIRGPRDQIRGTTEDPELQWLNKAKKYQELFVPTSELTEEKVRDIIKEAGPKEEPLSEEKIGEIARETAATVIASKEQEDKEERRHSELLRAIERSGTEKIVEGYKSDSYRFMGQGMSELAAVAKEKQPVKFLVELVKPETRPGKEIEPEATEGIFKRVETKYIAEE